MNEKDLMYFSRWFCELDIENKLAIFCTMIDAATSMHDMTKKELFELIIPLIETVNGECGDIFKE